MSDVEMTHEEKRELMRRFVAEKMRQKGKAIADQLGLGAENIVISLPSNADLDKLVERHFEPQSETEETRK